MINQIKVTVIIIITAIAAYFGVRYMKGLPLMSQSKVVYTTFEKANGLSSGSYIYINGVKVGTVQNIALAGRDSVRVKLNFDPDIKITKGSVAYLESGGLLGNKAIYVERGAGSQIIPANGVIEGEYDGGKFESLENSGQEITQKASESFDRLNKILSQTQQIVDQKNIYKINHILANLQGSTAQLSQLMKNERGEMEASMNHLNHFLANLDTISTQNKTQIKSAMASLNQTMQNFQRASTKLDTILAKVNNGKGSLGKLINDPTFANKLDSLSGSFNQLLENIKKNPAKYLKGLKLVNVF